MPKPKPNPLYAKKSGESAADHMRRLRKEFPTKFGKQPGPNKNPTKRFTAADLREAEQRAVDKALRKLKTHAPESAEKISSPPAPVESVARTASVEAPVAAAPVISPAAPAPISPPPPNPAPQIVSEAEIFSPAPPPEATPGPGTPPPPEPTPAGSGAPPSPGALADGRRYAVMVWGMIVKICCGIFGDGFQPMVLKSETGEVLYDENVEGVKVWLNYLASIGIKAFSPGVELWLFMSMYVGMRFPLIIAKFRRKKPATTQAGGKVEPQTEAPAPSPSESKSPAPAPAPDKKSAPVSPTPAGKVEIVEADESQEGFL